MSGVPALAEGRDFVVNLPENRRVARFGYRFCGRRPKNEHSEVPDIIAEFMDAPVAQGIELRTSKPKRANFLTI